MITEKMIEAAARAIIRTQGHDPDEDWAIPEPREIPSWSSHTPEPAWTTVRDEARAALEAAERAAWRPIEEADPEREYLLYSPEKITGAHKQAKLPARVVVGYPGDSPNRPPTHSRPLPSPPEAPKGEE